MCFMYNDICLKKKSYNNLFRIFRVEGNYRYLENRIMERFGIWKNVFYLF